MRHTSYIEHSTAFANRHPISLPGNTVPPQLQSSVQPYPPNRHIAPRFPPTPRHALPTNPHDVRPPRPPIQPSTTLSSMIQALTHGFGGTLQPISPTSRGQPLPNNNNRHPSTQEKTYLQPALVGQVFGSTDRLHCGFSTLGFGSAKLQYERPLKVFSRMQFDAPHFPLKLPSLSKRLTQLVFQAHASAQPGYQRSPVVVKRPSSRLSTQQWLPLASWHWQCFWVGGKEVSRWVGRRVRGAGGAVDM